MSKTAMKPLLIGTFILLYYCAIGQSSKPSVHDKPIPRNLKGCFKMLDLTMPENEILLIKTLKEDSIYYHSEFRSMTDFFHAWKLYDGSRLTKYFNKKGLYGSHEIYETILISYHRQLNKDSIKLDEQIKKYQKKQKEDNEKYIARTLQDTLNGVYIPKDLKDCFVQLDKILNEKSKANFKELKNRTEMGQYHHGFGMQLRNMWGLWGGSRLQIYFLSKNVKHPDAMSSKILEFYYDWLHNNNGEWQNWSK